MTTDKPAEEGGLIGEVIYSIIIDGVGVCEERYRSKARRRERSDRFSGLHK
jgi:hypothetical protein